MDSCFFDATTVDPLNSGFDPIPEGDYEAMIIKSENKATKSGTGSYLELQVQVVSGEHAKRIIWSRLNLKNTNPKAVEMAKRELSAICHAVGVLRPKTKEDLHGIPMIIHVVQCDDGRGGKSNDIKAWKAKSQAAQAVETQTAQAEAPAQQTGAGDRPW